MILNNFYKWLDKAPKFSINGAVGDSSSSLKTTTSDFKNISGNDLTRLSGVYRYTDTVSQQGLDIVKAWGNVADFAAMYPSGLEESDFSADDYSVLANSDITQSSLTVTTSSTATGYQIIATASYSNSSATDLTINSVLITRKSRYMNNGSDNTVRYDELLVIEQALSEPLLVPANTDFTLTATINIVRP